MKLLNSNETSFLFALSEQEELSIDADFHEWCQTIIGTDNLKWNKPNRQIEISDAELALKFKLRWALEE